jgi:hypothetical protein
MTVLWSQGTYLFRSYSGTRGEEHRLELHWLQQICQGELVDVCCGRVDTTDIVLTSVAQVSNEVGYSCHCPNLPVTTDSSPLSFFSITLLPMIMHLLRFVFGDRTSPSLPVRRRCISACDFTYMAHEGPSKGAAQ